MLGRSFRLAAAAVAAGAALLSATAASACGYGYYGYSYGYGSAYYSPCGARYVTEPAYPVDQGPVYAAPAAPAVELPVEHDPHSYPYVHRAYSYGYGPGYGYDQGYGYGRGSAYIRGYGYGRGYGYRHGYGYRSRHGYGHRHGYGQWHRARLDYAPDVYRRPAPHPRHRAVADRGYRTGVDRRDEVAPRRGAAAPAVVRERRREGPRPEELEGGPARHP